MNSYSFCINFQISFDLMNIASDVQDWAQTKYVRFQFYNMPQEFGLFANNFVSIHVIFLSLHSCLRHVN